MSPRDELGCHAVTSLAVPQRNRLAFAPSILEHVGERGSDARGVVADQSARSERHRDRPFRVLAQCETRNAQHRTFFLKAAGICEDDGRARYQRHGVDVRLRTDADQIALPRSDEVFESHSTHGAARARMHGEDQRQLLRELMQQAQQLTKHCGIVDIRRPVQRHEPISPTVETERRGRAARTRDRQLREETVDHHVADQADLRVVYSFALQVRYTAWLGYQKQVRHGVGEQPVDLLWHRAVEAAKSCLDVRHRNAELDGSQRAGNRAVDISEHHSPVRPPLHQVRLVSLDDARRLDAMRTGSDVEMNVGRRNSKIAEENIRHGWVVVLTGVNDADREVRMCAQPADDGSKLHEVRTRASNEIEDGFHDRGRR